MQNARLAWTVTCVTWPPRLCSRRPGDYTLELHLHILCTAWFHQNSSSEGSGHLLLSLAPPEFFFRMFRTSSQLDSSSECSGHLLLRWRVYQFHPHQEQDVGGMRMAPQTNERPALCIASSWVGEMLSVSRISNTTSEHSSGICLLAELREVRQVFWEWRLIHDWHNFDKNSRLFLSDHWVTFTPVITITERLHCLSV